MSHIDAQKAFMNMKHPDLKHVLGKEEIGSQLSPNHSPNQDRKFPTRKAPALNTGYANVKWLTSGFKPHKENMLLIAIKNNKLTICKDEKSYQVTLICVYLYVQITLGKNHL